ncbi:MAG: hypothetical protein K2X66_00075 [Cyanobacteria bacterium]|nr:hypothetical protein [Cyanobacteriota bacterium]
MDTEILQLAKRILLLSEEARSGEQAQWKLTKIHDAAKALVPRVEQASETLST